MGGRPNRNRPPGRRDTCARGRFRRGPGSTRRRRCGLRMPSRVACVWAGGAIRVPPRAAPAAAEDNGCCCCCSGKAKSARSFFFFSSARGAARTRGGVKEGDTRWLMARARGVVLRVARGLVGFWCGLTSCRLQQRRRRFQSRRGVACVRASCRVSRPTSDIVFR